MNLSLRNKLKVFQFALLVGMVSFLFVFAAGSLAAEPTREEKWRQDLRYLAEKLPRVHKNAFFKVTKFEGASGFCGHPPDRAVHH